MSTTPEVCSNLIGALILARAACELHTNNGVQPEHQPHDWPRDAKGDVDFAEIAGRCTSALDQASACSEFVAPDFGAQFWHTQGPWLCYADLPSTDPNWHIITSANRMRLIANVHIEPGNPMDAANAALLTSAPVIVAALDKAAALLNEALHVHIYDAQNGQTPPPDCEFVSGLAQINAALDAARGKA